MFNKKENEKMFKLGDCVILVEKIINDACVVLEIRSRELGAQTMVKVPAGIAKQIVCFVKEAEAVNSLPQKVEFRVQAKHRDYHDHLDGNGRQYRYYSSKQARLVLMSVGGHCIISLLGDDESHHSYHTTSFRADRGYIAIKDLGLHIAKLAGEWNMHQW